MADRCYYCETDRVDHRHGDGHSCGDCCGMHGMLTHPDYKDGEYKWVAKCIKAKNARIAELEAQLAASGSSIFCCHSRAEADSVSDIPTFAKQTRKKAPADWGPSLCSGSSAALLSHELGDFGRTRKPLR